MGDLYQNKYMFLKKKGKYHPISTNYLMHGGAEETLPIQQPKSDQSQPDTTQPDQSQPDQSQPGQSQPDQSQPDQSQPEQSQPDTTQPGQSQPSSAIDAGSNLLGAFADAAGDVASVFVEQGAGVAKKLAETGTKAAAQAADTYIDAQAMSMGIDPNAPVEVYTDKLVNKAKIIGDVAEKVANDPEVKQSIKATTSAATGIAKDIIDEAKVPAGELTEELIKTGSVVLDKGVEGSTRAAGNAFGAMIGAIPGLDVLYEGFRTGSTMASTGLSMVNEAMETGSKANELIQDTSQSILGKANTGLNGIPGDIKQPGLIKASDGLIKTINRIASSVRESGESFKESAQKVSNSDNSNTQNEVNSTDNENSVKDSDSTMKGGKKRKKNRKTKKKIKKKRRKTLKK